MRGESFDGFHPLVDELLGADPNLVCRDRAAAIQVARLAGKAFVPGLGRETALPRLVERHLVVPGGRDVNVVLSAGANGARACREPAGEDIDRLLACIDAVLRKIFGLERGSSRRPCRYAAGMTRIDEHHQLARLGRELLQAPLHLRIDETVSVVGEKRFGTTLLRILHALSPPLPRALHEPLTVPP